MASFRKPFTDKRPDGKCVTEYELRLDLLTRYNVLNENIEPDLEYIVQITQNYFDTSMAVINFMDDRFFWCKAQRGVPFFKRTRANTFSGSTLQHRSLHVVEDALADISWKDNILVLEPPNMRFYAGCPLLCGDDIPIGTVSISDTVPRHFSGGDLLFLRTVARLALDVLDAKIARWRRASAGAERVDGTWRRAGGIHAAATRPVIL